MIIAILAASVAALKPLPPPGCNADAMLTAASERLYPEFGLGPSDLGAWLGQDTPETVRAFRARVVLLRRRASNIKDECSRSAYLEWANYYDQQASGAESEFRDHHIAREQADYRRRLQQERVAAHAAHISPLPPKE